MYKILQISFVILALVGFIFAMNFGINKTEINECNKWNKEAKEYTGYYFTQNQIDQCDAHEITLTLK